MVTDGARSTAGTRRCCGAEIAQNVTGSFGFAAKFGENRAESARQLGVWDACRPRVGAHEVCGARGERRRVLTHGCPEAAANPVAGDGVTHGASDRERDARRLQIRADHDGPDLET